MWYVDELQDWMIGPIGEVGKAKGALTSYGNKKTLCPSNVKNLWEYWNGYAWILSSDIKITDIHANPSKSKFNNTTFQFTKNRLKMKIMHASYINVTFLNISNFSFS